MSNSQENAIDYSGLMEAHLVRVFNERDANLRIKAIGELYAENAVLYEPERVAGSHAEISEAVTELLASLPPTFSFTAIAPAVGHHGLGRLRWQAGPPNGPVAVTGMDVARFDSGKILTLHVFIDGPPA